MFALPSSEVKREYIGKGIELIEKFLSPRKIAMTALPSSEVKRQYIGKGRVN